MEQWFKGTVSANIVDEYGSLYQGIFSWKFPVAFKTFEYAVCFRAQYGTGAAWGTLVSYTANTATIRIFDISSRSGNDLHLGVYAKGKWK